MKIFRLSWPSQARRAASGSSVFSSVAEKRHIEEDFLARVASAGLRNVLPLRGRHRTQRAASFEQAPEGLMQALEAGAFDTALLQRLSVAPAAPERFDDVEPFDVKAWARKKARRHG